MDGDEGRNPASVFGEAFGDEGVVQEGGEHVGKAGEFLSLEFILADQLLVLEMVDDVPVVNSGDEAVGNGSDGIVDVGLGGEDVKCRLGG